MKRVQRPKVPDLMSTVRTHLRRGAYRDTRHATERKRLRAITLDETLHVLETGRHEKRKDKWEELYGSWNYAVRGKDIDGHDLRVIVAFEVGLMFIVTVMFATGSR